MISEVVNVLEIADLDKPIDGTQELRAPRIVKDKEDIQKVKKLIKDTLNPSDKSTNVNALFNIRTGRGNNKAKDFKLCNRKLKKKE